MEISRTLSEYGDLSHAVVVLVAVVRVWKEHGKAIRAWGTLHVKGGALVDVGSIAEA